MNICGSKQSIEAVNRVVEWIDYQQVSVIYSKIQQSLSNNIKCEKQKAVKYRVQVGKVLPLLHVGRSYQVKKKKQKTLR